MPRFSFLNNFGQSFLQGKSLLKTHICPGFKISGFTELMELIDEIIGENELEA